MIDPKRRIPWGNCASIDPSLARCKRLRLGRLRFEQLRLVEARSARPVLLRSFVGQPCWRPCQGLARYSAGVRSPAAPPRLARVPTECCVSVAELLATLNRMPASSARSAGVLGARLSEAGMKFDQQPRHCRACQNVPYRFRNLLRRPPGLRLSARMVTACCQGERCLAISRRRHSPRDRHAFGQLPRLDAMPCLPVVQSRMDQARRIGPKPRRVLQSALAQRAAPIAPQAALDALQGPQRQTRPIRRNPPTAATMPGVKRPESKLPSRIDRPAPERRMPAALSPTPKPNESKYIRYPLPRLAAAEQFTSIL